MKNGQNNIERNSKQSNVFVDDQQSTRNLMRQVEQAQQGGQPFYYYEVSIGLSLCFMISMVRNIFMHW